MDEMSESDDTALLEAWTSEGSEQAFAALARRYGGLLYHAALRRTGRADLAGEAAQNALLILARKAARLRHLSTLAGWLHRTACYEASKLLRREHRHEARMKRLHSSAASHESHNRWQDALPLLDQALDALPERDRQVIFLKYFDCLSFEEIARRFGGEPAAWRQRGSRAVERLRLSLGKRGVAVSSSALASGIGTSLSQAAPASVMTALSSSPVAAAAALSWPSLTTHTIHFMKLHPATWVVATLVLSVIPLTVQAVANSSARQRVATLESTLAGLPSRETADQRKTSLSVAAKAAKPNLLWLADQIAAGNGGSRLARQEVKIRLMNMSEEELEQLLLDTLSTDFHQEKRYQVIKDLFVHYVIYHSPQVPTENVIHMAELLSDQLGIKGQEFVWSWMTLRIPEWTKKDPEGVVAWYRAGVESGRLDPARITMSLAGSIYSSLRQIDPEKAKAFHRTLGDNELSAAAHYWTRFGTPEEFLDLAVEIGNPAKRQTTLLSIFQHSTKGKSPDEVVRWIERTGASGKDTVELLAIAAEGDPYREDGGVRFHEGMKTHQIAERIEWLRDPAIGENSAAAIGAFLAGTMQSAPSQTKEALDAEWKRNPDEDMLAAYIRRAGSSVAGAVDALRRSTQISDPDLRTEILHDLLQGRGVGEALKSLSDQEIEQLQLPAGLIR